jgi:hypothetical protein
MAFFYRQDNHEHHHPDPEQEGTPVEPPRDRQAASD